jgi:2-C-methyl-D-erythritol 4-phosphate cytidylyltransferase
MISAILVAGGRGRRFGGDVPKQFQTLRGMPLLVWSARRLLAAAPDARLVVVAPPEEHDRCRALLASMPLSLAPAGDERQQSVASGLTLVDSRCELVVVHDAVRPLVAAAAIAACIETARVSGAAILAAAVADTVKRAVDGVVTETVARADLWLAQTPQVFRADLLRRAHAEAARLGILATDDAALVERLDVPVRIVPGSHINRKITTPDDLAWAEAMVAGDPTLQP